MTHANIPMTDGAVRLLADRGARLLTTGIARRTAWGAAWLATLVLCTGATAQEVDLSDLASLEFHKTEGEWASHQGSPGLRVTEPADERNNEEDKLVIIDVPFTDGAIEVELSGEPAPGAAGGARGFVGVAFHVQPGGEAFEAFYIRPTNGRAEDQLRRNHSTQYIAFPDYPWHRLREETPGLYEAYSDLVPGEWTRYRVEVEGEIARLYLHGNEQPTLLVNDLKLAGQGGAVGLWIGPGTVAHFRNLSITPE